MIVIIPLGGIGNRFKKENYTKPKALIDILGKPILYYLIENINSSIELLYIPYNKEYEKYDFENLLIHDFPNIRFKFLKLEKNTLGAAHTINIALNNLDIKDMPILCLDSDAFYTDDIVKLWNSENKIFNFIDTQENPIFSYIKLDKENYIVDIKEKEKISDLACSGAYGFNSYKQLLKYTQKILDNNIRQKDEFYTSGVIYQMIQDNIQFKNHSIDLNNFFSIGTPIQVNEFIENKVWDILNNNNNKNDLMIDGHSNFNVNILEINNTYYLCKSSNHYEDALRLQKQLDKQILYQKLFNNNIPLVNYSSTIQNDKNFFLMEFKHKTIDIITYFKNYSFVNIDNFVEKIIFIIEDYISKCTFQKINKEILSQKINNIENNIKNIDKNIFNDDDNQIINESLTYLNDKISEIININIPIGYCHGDLTLSNILIDPLNNKLFLIDFLDSFIESPIFDIVKIRQDTKFCWTLELYNHNLDKNKIRIIMNELDNKIDNYFKKYVYYELIYKYFEIMNILRIIQYCKSTKIKEYLIKCLINIHSEK